MFFEFLCQAPIEMLLYNLIAGRATELVDHNCQVNLNPHNHSFGYVTVKKIRTLNIFGIHIFGISVRLGMENESSVVWGYV